MTDAGMRIFVTIVFGVVCLAGFVMVGLIVHDMALHSGWSAPGAVFSLLELTLGCVSGWIVWRVHHD